MNHPVSPCRTPKLTPRGRGTHRIPPFSFITHPSHPPLSPQTPLSPRFQSPAQPHPEKANSYQTDWKKGLSKLAEEKTKKKLEQTLKIEIDAEAFSRLYGHTSHPFPVEKGQKVAVRVVSQFGEETTKVLEA